MSSLSIHKRPTNNGRKQELPTNADPQGPGEKGIPRLSPGKKQYAPSSKKGQILTWIMLACIVVVLVAVILLIETPPEAHVHAAAEVESLLSSSSQKPHDLSLEEKIQRTTVTKDLTLRVTSTTPSVDTNVKSKPISSQKPPDDLGLDEKRRTVTEDSTLTTVTSTTTPSVDTNVENKPICFTTSIFGTSVEAADKPQNVENYFPKFKPSEYDFILFTNLEDMPAPGWTKIVKKDLPYRRFITQSRYGKFVGWREKALSHCGTVIFSDGYVLPQPKLEIFHKVAKRVTESELGLSQVMHHRYKQGVDNIVKSILQQQKDLPENAKVTLKWLRAQPDFRKYMPYYLGKYFGKFSRRLYRDCSHALLSSSLLNNDAYSPCSCATLTRAVYDPSNPKFREVSSYFWDTYSQEKGMWRDQLLWSYAIHHFNVTPLVLMNKTNGDYMNGGNMFIEKKKSRGFGGHRYGANADNNAEVAANNTSDTQQTPADSGEEIDSNDAKRLRKKQMAMLNSTVEEAE
jgi:hypothetical protein